MSPSYMFDKAKQFFTTMLAGTGDVAVTNTSAETSILPATAVGTRVFPANTLVVGSTIRVILRGMYSAASLPGNAVFRVKLGGVTVATGTASALLALATSQGFSLNVTLTVRTIGAAGTVVAGGEVGYIVAAGQKLSAPLNTAADVAVNTTVANTLEVTAQWASALGQNSLVIKTATIERLDG